MIVSWRASEMMTSWRGKAPDGAEYWWSGIEGSREVEGLVDQYEGEVYVSSSGLVCGPGPYTPLMVFNLFADQVPYFVTTEIVEDDQPEDNQVPDGAWS